MRRLTTEEKREIFEEYRSIDTPIKVVDFETACQRCKQKLVDNMRAKHAKEERRQRATNPNRQAYDRQYYADVPTGKRNIPSAGNMRSFAHYVKTKYGSLGAYNYMKQLKERERELAFKE